MDNPIGYEEMPDRPWRPTVRRGFFWHANWLGTKVAVNPDFRVAKWQALLAVVTLRLFGYTRFW